MSDSSLDLVQGTLDLLILKTLQPGAAHGYGISYAIRTRTRETLHVQDAALYQALRRLEGKKLVEADWGVSENNRRARYYRLTTSGRAHLRAQTRRWRRYVDAVFLILEPAAGDA